MMADARPACAKRVTVGVELCGVAQSRQDKQARQRRHGEPQRSVAPPVLQRAADPTLAVTFRLVRHTDKMPARQACSPEYDYSTGPTAASLGSAYVPPPVTAVVQDLTMEE